MYNAFLQRTKETIRALTKHIQSSDRFRESVLDNSLRCFAEKPCFDILIGSPDAVPDRIEWRIIDHCAAVTRIYAIYEQFSHEMIREHLSLLQGRMSFFNLPETIQSSYRAGIARILEKMDGPRYGDINLSVLVREYDNALSGGEYVLEPRAMLIHDQNLRIPELHRLMGRCGVDGVDAWIHGHSLIKDFFQSSERLSASAGSEMAELIKYRNDAAHGSIDIGDILHVNVLLEFCDFISVVCEVIAERVQLAGLNSLKSCNHVEDRGKISESFQGALVGVGVMTGDFKVGQTVYLCGESYCLERSITSLQLEGTSHEAVNLTSATELGFKFDAPCKKNAAVLMVCECPEELQGSAQSEEVHSSEAHGTVPEMSIDLA